MVIKSFKVALAALVAVTMLAAPVLAADTLGFVDVQKVFDGYEKTQKSKTDLEAFGKQLDQQLQILAQYKLLDDNDSRELMQLSTKATPTDKDKERIKTLQDKEKTVDTELKDLQAKKEPTEQEKAKLKELQGRSAKADEALLKLNEDAQKQFDEKKNQISEEIRGDILKAIEAIAKQKNISMVVDKVVIFYGGTDLTDPVLKKLNGK